ncbi:DUF4157 domain-containing protein [Streptomyces sp. NRRL WC-3742]|uniref:eCIS core domain-containing protein n=1 Tax=Streptomyces sp. NRRL WC-3742 TaxID=1463934 RepID=UPI000AC6826C
MRSNVPDKASDREAPDRPTRHSTESAAPLSLLALQRMIGNAAVVQRLRQAGHLPPDVQRSAVPDVLRSAGRPLDSATRTEMEARLGADFGDVRIHDDTTAQRSAAEVGARAYTSGSHVVIGAGGADKHTLAHELTHVIQQRQGPVAGADNGSGLRVSDPGDTFERAAEANATRVMAGPAPVQRAAETLEDGQGHGAAAEGFVQRAATPARIGFEFQQLDSEVTVKTSGGSETESDSDAEVYEVAVSHYGADSGLWYVVQDGENLEFVTKPFSSGEELAAAMKEISKVARQLCAVATRDLGNDPDSSPAFEIGDVYVTVHSPDTKGQPQVNPDVPLDSLPALYQRAAGDDEHFDELYGANEKFWRSSRTKNEIAVNGEVAAKIRALDPARLAEAFRMAPDPSGEKLGSVQGMLQAIAAAVVHQTMYKTKLPKDQPVLLKTHMGHLWQSLADDGVIGAGVNAAAVVSLLTDLGDELGGELEEDEQSMRIARKIVTDIMSGKDPVWASMLDPVDIGAPAQEGGPATGDRKQILVELRRVPILEIGAWTDFAASSFDHFITDLERAYHQDL